MGGKFFEDWDEGAEYLTPSRTMTETDVVMFAAMSGDYNELHTSEEYMKNTQFGRRLVHGLLGLAVSHGLLFRTGLLEGTSIAFLEIESWRFQAPIFFGDTIRVKIKVAEKRASRSKPDRGIVKLYLEVINQEGTVVQSGFKTLMMRRRPS
ncbi:MAG: MaoC family dehydratase N-terminal domain-containing protein [Deltaproteobacteria bacterium]|nr:MaoC family dehydratase N-terminal domain-containing protein [Deltaproteobacteria bacterium]MBW2120859.1 MaoC family dehydratase N-terminal domain-containing protein [Deltaproteobacteria bacterium]